MNQPNQKQDPPFVQMILGIFFCSCSLLFIFEVIQLDKATRFRWIVRPLNEWFGRWWAVGFCLVIGLTVFFMGLKRYKNSNKRIRE